MPSLSPRESEILRAVCEGRTTKEIAAALGITESTVNWHVANTLRKLDAASRAEAVFKAFRAGLLDGVPSLRDAAPPERPALERHVRPVPRSTARAAIRMTARWAVAAALVMGSLLTLQEIGRASPLFRLGPVQWPAPPAAGTGR